MNLDPRRAWSGASGWPGSPSKRRLASLVLTAVILGVAVALLVGNVALMEAHGAEDFLIYRRHATEWLDGGSFYDPRQLAGPYTVQAGDSLYPPPFALVMLPFLLLPAVLWWAIPLATIGWVVARHRPRPWTWPLIALCIAAPRTLALAIYGNPTMWVAMAVALGTVWRWPAVLAVLKPSLAFFALIGVRDRWFWIAGGVLLLVSLAMLPDWREYLTAMSNLRDENLTYSLFDSGFVLIGVIAWAGRTPRRQR
jgi:hypothetical protein